MKHSRKATRIGAVISFLPIVLYVISAGILAVIAAALLFEGIEITISALTSGAITEESTDIYGALFHAATAIALLETIEVYFRSHRFALEVLFLAGVAEVIRHILIYDLKGISEGDILTSGVLLGGLIAGVLITRNLQGRNPVRNQNTRRSVLMRSQGLLSRITKMAG